MTKDSVQKAIVQLESINPKDSLAYEKAFLAFYEIHSLPLFSCDIKSKTPVYRSRIHKSEEIFFTNTDELTFPPCENVLYYARCNRPNQSMFYCSENKETSYFELAEYLAKTKKNGELFYVTTSEWILRSSVPVIVVTTPEKGKRASVYDKENGKILDENELSESEILLYNYLFEKFRKSAKQDLLTYIITTAYCNLILSNPISNVKGIYYPSVPFGGKGVNFAINSEFATNENIELKSVFRSEMIINKNSDIPSFLENDRIMSKNIDISKKTIEW